MTACIRFFCANLAACFALAASQPVELQFLPNEIAEITSFTRYSKEIAFQQEVSTFAGNQEIRMDLSVDEEAARFPFHLTLLLSKIHFNNSKNGQNIEIGAIEKAEAQSLLNYPLKFILKERGQPLELESDQKKLFGSCQLLSHRNITGLFEEDIQDLFLFADMPLKVGESFSFSKKFGEVELPIVYSVKEITLDDVTITFLGKLDRTKVAIKDMAAEAEGELHGKILWHRKNNLHFTSSQEGNFRYKFQIKGQDAEAKVEFSKNTISRIKTHG